MILGLARIVIGFGEEAGSGDIPEKVNPMIDGLTTGNPLYDGVFVMRNPENCNIVDFTLKNIPIYMSKKLIQMYNICMDFNELPVREDFREIPEDDILKIKDLQFTLFVIDPSNYNTSILRIKDSEGNTLVVSGDFKNYDGAYGGQMLEVAVSIIKRADVLVLEGKYLGKYGIEYSSGRSVTEKLKNIMKFYKQVFVIQSETDLITTSNIYDAALRTKKILIESTYVANLATLAGRKLSYTSRIKKSLFV